MTGAVVSSLKGLPLQQDVQAPLKMDSFLSDKQEVAELSDGSTWCENESEKLSSCSESDDEAQATSALPSPRSCNPQNRLTALFEVGRRLAFTFRESDVEEDDEVFAQGKNIDLQ